jgi:hypothetical protein
MAAEEASTLASEDEATPGDTIRKGVTFGTVGRAVE